MNSPFYLGFSQTDISYLINSSFCVFLPIKSSNILKQMCCCRQNCTHFHIWKLVFLLMAFWNASSLYDKRFHKKSFLFGSPQCGQSPPSEPDDHRQPGCGFWTDVTPPPGGDGGRHHGHQVPEHRRGNPHRAPREGERRGNRRPLRPSWRLNKPFDFSVEINSWVIAH